jgi:hypothetical protein
MRRQSQQHMRERSERALGAGRRPGARQRVVQAPRELLRGPRGRRGRRRVRHQLRRQLQVQRQAAVRAGCGRRQAGAGAVRAPLRHTARSMTAGGIAAGRSPVAGAWARARAGGAARRPARPQRGSEPAAARGRERAERAQQRQRVQAAEQRKPRRLLRQHGGRGSHRAVPRVPPPVRAVLHGVPVVRPQRRRTACSRSAAGGAARAPKGQGLDQGAQQARRAAARAEAGERGGALRGRRRRPRRRQQQREAPAAGARPCRTMHPRAAHP